MMNFARTEHIDHAAKLNEEVAIQSFLDHMFVKKKEAEPKRPYLGGSRIGHPMAPQPWDRGCDRALWFEHHKYPPLKGWPAHLYRIFEMGHAIEEIMLGNLRAAGFTVLAIDEQTKKQFGFELARDPETGIAMYQGHLDGVIVDGPALIGGEKDGLRLKYPFLWENKAVNTDKFEKFKAEGLERSHAMYYGQMQQYMNFLNLYQNPGLITVLDRNTGHIWPEFIRFNQRHAQATIDRASRVLAAAGALVLERANNDYEKMPCKFCDFIEHCKAAEINRTPPDAHAQQQAPKWLSGGNVSK